MVGETDAGMRTMPARATLTYETQHLLTLLEDGLLLPRDVEASLARMRRALVDEMQAGGRKPR